MKTTRFAFLSAIAVTAIVSVSQHAAAQLVIDDFSSGFYGKTLSTGTATDTQTGTMAGGTRETDINVCVPASTCPSYNPFDQPNSYQIKKATKTTPAVLIFNTGYQSLADLQVFYGLGSPMNLDLSSYDRIRVYFNGADQLVNLNLVVSTNGPWSALGCNFTDPYTSPISAFTVDLPFANFSSNGGAGADFSDLTLMDFEFDASQGYATGEDWAVTSFQAVLGGTADVTCGSPAN